MMKRLDEDQAKFWREIFRVAAKACERRCEMVLPAGGTAYQMTATLESIFRDLSDHFDSMIERPSRY